MITKNVKGILVPRHDTAMNWSKATNFTPRKGEIVIFDADAENVSYETSVKIGTLRYDVKSSQSTRFKIGDGVHNVNALEFLNGAREEWVKEWVTEYVKKRTDVSTLVYLNTKEVIGRNLEMQDVFPVQSDAISLKVVSKNMIKYTISNEAINGVNVKTSNADGVYLKVTGKATSGIKKKYNVAEAILETPGNYIFSSSHIGLGTSTPTATKRCYLEYSLYDKAGRVVVENVRYAPKDGYVSINTKELNCYKLKISLCIDVQTNATFNDSNSLDFKLQVEYGDKPTSYKDAINVDQTDGVKVNIYGRNLFISKDVFDKDLSNTLSFPSTHVGDVVYLDGTLSGTIKDRGTHYFKGTMVNDYLIEYNNGNENEKVKIGVPLVAGDDYTLIYQAGGDVSSDVVTPCNIQIVYGHTDYEEYKPYECISVVSGADGICDINKLNYPYTFVSISNAVENKDKLALYAMYDPALSRNWTERQLHKLYSMVENADSAVSTRLVDLGMVVNSDFSEITNANLNEDTLYVCNLAGPAYNAIDSVCSHIIGTYHDSTNENIYFKFTSFDFDGKVYTLNFKDNSISVRDLATEGSSPVKGVDYWTAEDKQEIVDSVLSSLELSADGIKLNDAVTEDTYTLYVADGKLTLRKESDQ